MQPKKQSQWPLWLLLAVGIWLAAGRPGLDVVPGGSAPFAVPDGKMSVVSVIDRATATRQQLTAEALAHKAADESGIRYRETDPKESVANDAEWVRNAAAAAKLLAPGTRLLISDGKRGEVLDLTGDPTATVKKYGN